MGTDDVLSVEKAFLVSLNSAGDTWIAGVKPGHLPHLAEVC